MSPLSEFDFKTLSVKATMRVVEENLDKTLANTSSWLSVPWRRAWTLSKTNREGGCFKPSKQLTALAKEDVLELSSEKYIKYHLELIVECIFVPFSNKSLLSLRGN